MKWGAATKSELCYAQGYRDGLRHGALEREGLAAEIVKLESEIFDLNSYPRKRQR